MMLIDTLAQGMLLGGLYALFAAGLSLVFGIMRLVNLAHGDLIIAAAYLILTLTSLTGLHPFVAVVLAAYCGYRGRLKIRSQPAAFNLSSPLAMDGLP